MQTKYDPSSNPYAQPNPEIESIAQSELPPAVKTGSLVALIAVILGTLIGSLLASPDPAEIAAQQEDAEVTTTELSSEPESTTFESSTSTLTPPITTPASPTTNTTSTPSIAEPTAPATDPTSSITLDSNLTNSDTATPLAATPGADTTTATIEPESAAPITTPSPTAEIETPATPATPETSQNPMTSSSVATPTTPDTATGNSMPEIKPTTPETTTAVDPTPLATTGSEDMAASTTPDPAKLEQLSQSVYQTINQAWITTPVTEESVYRVKVDENGSILSFEPKSQVASENVDNTPLADLATSKDVTTAPSFAEFDVIFLPSGLLEVNQAE
jgi:hypothetical protein